MKALASATVILLVLACGPASAARVDDNRQVEAVQAQVVDVELAHRVAVLEAQVQALASRVTVDASAPWASVDECVATVMPFVPRIAPYSNTLRYRSWNIKGACSSIVAITIQPPPRVATVLSEAAYGRANYNADRICDLERAVDRSSSC